MDLNTSEFPVKDTIRAGGEPVDLSFRVLATFGSHDSSESGEELITIVDTTGTRHCITSLTQDWQQLVPGIFLRAAATYSRSTRETATYVRILPEACTVTLHVRKVYRYSASDYPHSGGSEDRCYAIVVRR